MSLYKRQLPLTYFDSTYIRADGVTTTTAIIPFAQGIFIPDSKFASFGNTSGSPDLKVYSDGTNALITSLNEADIIITASNGTGDNNGRTLSLQGGLTVGDGNNGGVRTGTSVTNTVSIVGAGITYIPNIADFAVGGVFKAGSLAEFAGAVGFDSNVYFTSLALLGSARVGLFEFLTDKIYFGITTGPTRKEIALNDQALTSGRIPFVTTNGRLTDSSAFLFSTSTGLTITDLNVVLSATTGTKFGTATTQKLGFFNATPIVQVGATIDLGTVLSNLGLRAAGTAYPITTSGTIVFSGTFGSSGVSSFTNTTDSSSNSTGGVKLSGGMGVAKSIYCGGNIACDVAGKGFYIKTGTNAMAGTGTLVGGTVTINTTAVQANSLIFITDTQAGVVNIGVPTVSAIVAGTSFTVTSSNVLDASTFNWIIFNQS